MLLLAFCLNCINGKYLLALPTPTTFEKVDQTFIIDWQINLLNHNSPQLLIKRSDNKIKITAVA